jgi:hypothetical protein
VYHELPLGDLEAGLVDAPRRLLGDPHEVHVDGGVTANLEDARGDCYGPARRQQAGPPHG